MLWIPLAHVDVFHVNHYNYSLILFSRNSGCHIAIISSANVYIYFEPTEKSRKVNHIKMKVIPNLKSETITVEVIKNVSKDSKIDSDDSTSYVKLAEVVSEHHPQVINRKEAGVILPWVHVAISNAKRLITNTFHDIKPEYLQLYLNEFCYKFNRRYLGNLLRQIVNRLC